MADFGEILEVIGHFGTYQKVVLFALSFPNMFVPFIFSSVIFIQSDPVRQVLTQIPSWHLSPRPQSEEREQEKVRGRHSVVGLPVEEAGQEQRAWWSLTSHWAQVPQGELAQGSRH